MSILDQLACSLGRRDEVPNQELARNLAYSEDQVGIQELVSGLTNTDPAIRADCIKAIYEVGYLKPNLITPYALDFLKLLKSRNNRLVWGGAIALSTIGVPAADQLFPLWEQIRKAMEGGSVITRDAGVSALAGIASTSSERRSAIFPYLLEHLRICRPKDVPQHSEKILIAVDAANKVDFIAVLEKRLEDLQGPQTKRVCKVIQQAHQR
jgi:hypothetical protein